MDYVRPLGKRRNFNNHDGLITGCMEGSMQLTKELKALHIWKVVKMLKKRKIFREFLDI